MLQLMLAHVRRDDHVAHLTENSAIPVEPFALHDLLSLASVPVKSEDSADFSVRSRWPREPKVSTSVRKRLESDLLQHNASRRIVDPPNDLGVERNTYGRLPSHHQTKELLANGPLSAPCLGRGTRPERQPPGLGIYGRGESQDNRRRQVERFHF
jgi:hypothetical protein